MRGATATHMRKSRFSDRLRAPMGAVSPCPPNDATIKKERRRCQNSSPTTITMNYDQQGTGEPLILIPYLAADHACYAFQVPEYARHFTCISVDLRGTGESDKPQGAYTTELLADDVAAFMQAVGIAKAHVAGLSLGAAVGMWLAAKYPDKVSSLSLHSGWTKTDRFLQDRRRKLADRGEGRGRSRDDHSGDFPVVLHA